MEQIQNQNHQTLSQFSRYQLLKKITQLLLSVSVFSLLLSNYSRLSFLCSFNFYFSSVPVQLFSHTIDKNCIFLLCNGLLVFVAKFSGLVCSSSSTYNNRSSIESVKNYEDDAAPLVLDQYSKVSLLEKEDLMAQENVAGEDEGKENDEYITGEVGKKETQQFILEDEPDEGESGFSITAGNKEGSQVLVEEDDDHQEEVIKEFDDKFPVQEEEEEEEEEYEGENGMLSTEELNKKFEEFIRKMKEEIRIEAQQKLVMVN
ncbi:hypothetical protein P3X46_027310 [Hevea brasiliensis]|uniref:DUF4408 domain-containing protein n=1 Tax=Hevea brasiliensis TaxID=3981 RepID=A0ABQ9L2G4_HEVBR|nr:putative E3 ubiquitin-protein ligase RING1a [Hevea brasiliensis]KAJ9153922.1 hypothetical protein P3X46_027310 [Hevea brasiliensis]